MQSNELLKTVQGLLPHDYASLGTIRETINSLINRIERGEAKQALDLDFRIDDQLVKLCAALRNTYRQTSDTATKNAARAAFAAAASLQWAIADQDILFSRRKSGYEASTVEEVEKVLDRIESEE
ncbi:hypothetical protein GJ699_24740 [Duganella sp. FT80W]|uniref:Uncharacterized protein n=1 Tax=Duganella guangzhouensis TaxID=2666084 RepID=A0A6I2L8N2_9BURK|nr:hypothetical protein [Duganella guangzhouensis]MRW93204.1 hypothetical protein [Duganella guangzhouensis]